MCRDAVRDVGVGFEDSNGFAEMVVLERPSGIDGECAAGLRPLLQPAFPSADVEQAGLDDLSPVGIFGSQQRVGELPDRLVGRPAVGLFRGPVPET